MALSPGDGSVPAPPSSRPHSRQSHPLFQPLASVSACLSPGMLSPCQSLHLSTVPRLGLGEWTAGNLESCLAESYCVSQMGAVRPVLSPHLVDETWPRGDLASPWVLSPVGFQVSSRAWWLPVIARLEPRNEDDNWAGGRVLQQEAQQTAHVMGSGPRS